MKQNKILISKQSCYNYDIPDVETALGDLKVSNSVVDWGDKTWDALVLGVFLDAIGDDGSFGSSGKSGTDLAFFLGDCLFCTTGISVSDDSSLESSDCRNLRFGLK